MNKGFILMDALVVVMLTMTLSLMLSSIKSLELSYSETKLSYEENEKLRIKEIEEINRCQSIKDLSSKII